MVNLEGSTQVLWLLVIKGAAFQRDLGKGGCWGAHGAGIFQIPALSAGEMWGALVPSLQVVLLGWALGLH